MTKPDGSGYFSVEEPLHLYPKNTEEKPEIDKNFADPGADYTNYD
ncbi:hypothetical protein CKO19_16650, partial [Rhodovulum adriaticum]|nr:hypothetical protein [Rhodovulum adriaticum]